MKKAKITLEVLTPMFSYGDKGTAEFRITELKSLIRSTFRELYCFEDIKDMKEKENKLFGNTEVKSLISFRLDQNVNIYKDGIGEAAMLPHKTNKTYKCIRSGYILEFYMTCKDNDDINIEFYIELLIQSSIIGAIGRRSRKGFGSFKICKVEMDRDSDIDAENKLNDLLKKSPMDLFKSYVANTEYKVRNNEEENDQQQENNKSLRFDKFNAKADLDYPYVKKINTIEIPNDSNYLELIKSISQLTHDRLGDELANNININILGNHKEKNKASSINRFACPVCVSFWENDNSKYMVIKELNYEYIFGILDIKKRDEKQVNMDYVDKYVAELIKIGEGKMQ